jgi:hypothetical protein
MREYKVESLMYTSKLTLDFKLILKNSTQDIQDKLESYSKEGWSLTSTDTINFGSGIYIYLYFERSI